MTGFWGSAGTVYISAKRRIFLTDARYTQMAREVVSGFDMVETRQPLEEIAKLIQADGVRRLGFDREVSFSFYQSLTEIFAGIEMVPQTNFVEDLRTVKDASEIEIIRRACQISDQAFLDVLEFVKPGKTAIPSQHLATALLCRTDVRRKKLSNRAMP